MKSRFFALLCILIILSVTGFYGWLLWQNSRENAAKDVISDENLQIDNILVQKAQRKMFLRHGEQVIYTYNISLGRNPAGAKIREGDKKTPEGKYYIVSHNPHSAYHLSLKISYPTETQKNAAHENGYSAGGDIMIHGFPNKTPEFFFVAVHKMRDWTAGCIAVTNREIEQIYRLVQDGTPITIEP